MKVSIGKYTTWIGPHQVLDWFVPIFGQKRIDEFRDGDWFENISDKTMPFFQWFEDRKHRKIKVKIDHWDTFSADHTLALVISPVLHKLQDDKHGSPAVDDEDVPEFIKSAAAGALENDWDTDEFFHYRWEWVVGEMIWAFDQYTAEDNDWESWYYTHHTEEQCAILARATGIELYEVVDAPFLPEHIRDDALKEHNDRLNNGLRLFGKYYRALWT